MKYVRSLEDILAEVNWALQIFYNHGSSIQTVMGACICWEDEADDCVARYLRLHLSGGTNHCASALSELHIIRRM